MMYYEDMTPHIPDSLWLDVAIQSPGLHVLTSRSRSVNDFSSSCSIHDT
jgi:hypothetical protein